jgi:hypothetical protein
MPIAVLLALIPPVSIACCLIVVSGLLMLGFYNPSAVLLGMAGVTIVGGLAHCAYLAQPEKAVAL